MDLVTRAGWLVLPALLQGCFFFDLMSRPPPPPPATGDTAPPVEETGLEGPQCFQQEAVELGLVNFVVSPLRLDETTLAADPALPTPSGPVPGSLADEAYYGAVDPEEPPWWRGWTYRDPAVLGGLPGEAFHPLQAEIENGDIVGATQSRCDALGFEDGGRVDVFGASFPVCWFGGRLFSDVTLTPDHVWVLIDDVTVGDGDLSISENPVPSSVELTIEAGTQIYAATGRDAGLVISRGSELRARGTAERPVLFGAVRVDFDQPDIVIEGPENLTGRGEWLGVVLSGSGRTNVGEAVIPSNDGGRSFGGQIDADRSGDLDYVVIAEGGLIKAGIDRAGLSLEAAGRSTTIDHVQILGSDDDCVQLFGGAAFVRHFVCSGPGRAGIDHDLGYTGEMQWALVRLSPNLGGVRAFEGGSNLSVFDAEPASAPRMANLTLLGDRSNVVAIHETGWQGRIVRSVYDDGRSSGFGAGCLDIDDTLPALLHYSDVVLDCAAPIAPCGDD